MPPPALSFSSSSGPFGTCCPAIWHFPSLKHNDCTARWVCDLVFRAIVLEKGRVRCPPLAIWTSTLPPAPSGPFYCFAFFFFFKFQSIFLGGTLCCSPKLLSFFILLLLTPNTEVLHSQYDLIFGAHRAVCWDWTLILNALQILPMCVYPAEQACPELFAILSASGTLSFVSSNEMERKCVLLTGCRSKGGTGQPMTGDGPCLSAGFGSRFSFVTGWSCSKCCQQERLIGVVCCSIMTGNATYLPCTLWALLAWHFICWTSWDPSQKVWNGLMWSNHWGTFSRLQTRGRGREIWETLLSFPGVGLLQSLISDSRSYSMRWIISLDTLLLIETIFFPEPDDSLVQSDFSVGQ